MTVRSNNVKSFIKSNYFWFIYNTGNVGSNWKYCIVGYSVAVCSVVYCTIWHNILSIQKMCIVYTFVLRNIWISDHPRLYAYIICAVSSCQSQSLDSAVEQQGKGFCLHYHVLSLGILIPGGPHNYSNFMRLFKYKRK